MIHTILQNECIPRIVALSTLFTIMKPTGPKAFACGKMNLRGHLRAGQPHIRNPHADR